MDKEGRHKSIQRVLGPDCHVLSLEGQHERVWVSSAVFRRLPLRCLLFSPLGALSLYHQLLGQAVGPATLANSSAEDCTDPGEEAGAVAPTGRALPPVWLAYCVVLWHAA